MNTKTSLALALAPALLLAGTAFANEPAPPVDTTLDPTPITQVAPTFEQLDTNRDGMIKQAEVPADHELFTLFSNVDSDGSKALSRGEFEMYLDDADDEEEAE